MLLLVLSESNFQSLAQQDSTKILSLTELKQTAQLLTELEKKRSQMELMQYRLELSEVVINNLKLNEQLYEAKIENLETYAEEVKTAWYDRFWIGSLLTGVAVTTIYFLAR